MNSLSSKNAFWFLLVVVTASFLGVFTLMHLWNWFIPITLGVAEIGFFQALAIRLVLSYFSGENTDASINNKDITELSIKLITRPLVFLGIGYTLTFVV